MERCPQCRARFKDGTVCRRCGVDLSLLLDIEAQVDVLSMRAVKMLLTGDTDAAAELASIARNLHATPFTRALVGFSGRTVD